MIIAPTMYSSLHYTNDTESETKSWGDTLRARNTKSSQLSKQDARKSEQVKYFSHPGKDKMKFTLFRTSPNLEKLRGSCFEEWWVRTGAGPTACIQNPEITRNYFKVCYCLMVPETHCSDSFATYWHSGWFSSVLDEWKGRTSLW